MTDAQGRKPASNGAAAEVLGHMAEAMRRERRAHDAFWDPAEERFFRLYRGAVALYAGLHIGVCSMIYAYSFTSLPTFCGHLALALGMVAVACCAQRAVRWLDSRFP